MSNAWTEQKHKAPLAFDEKEKKDLSEKELKELAKDFNKELLAGGYEPEPDPVRKPNVVVFDSKRGNTK